MKFLNNIFLIITISFLLFVGCTKRIDADIYNETTEYSLLDSSAKGIPLEAKIKSDDVPKNIEYHWHAEEGTLMLEKNGEFIELGKEVTNHGEKLYWQVDFDEETNISSFNISLNIIDLDKRKIIGMDSITVGATKDGSFVVK